MIRGYLGSLRSTMAGTWSGHGAVALGALTVGALLGTGADSPQGGAVIGAGGGLLYFVMREAANKVKHTAHGTYDEAARLDRVGDLVAPAFVFLAALLTWLAGRL